MTITRTGEIFNYTVSKKKVCASVCVCRCVFMIVKDGIEIKIILSFKFNTGDSDYGMG